MSITHSVTRSWLLCSALLGLAPFASLAQVEVKEITTRPGVTLKFVYAKAANPVANVVLFADGYGNPPNFIFQDGSRKYNNFLASDAARFTQHGISAVVADIPSDRSSLRQFLDTTENAQDSAALMAFLKQQSSAPVWAIGHGDGAVSAAAFSLLLKEKGPDGIVLASPVTKGRAATVPSLTTRSLNQIQAPTLVIHHKLDPCGAAPFEGSKAVIDALKIAKKLAFIPMEGGSTSNNSCYLGYHGYQGIEDAVIKQMADWIKSTQLELKP